MLKLICGPSGSGKTRKLTDLIRSDIEGGTRCFLLIPEQQAYISERDIPRYLPQNAGLYFEIVSFSGLAEDVFREYGGVTHSSMNTGLRGLLMWDTLRTLAPLLKQYGKSAGNDATLTGLMLMTVDEFRMNGIGSEQMEEAAKQLPNQSLLQNKLNDLALVDAVFHEKLESAFGEDPSDKLMRLSQLLEKYRYFDGCHIYIDSFTSFTVQEYTVLREILRQADCVTVSLCADSFSSSLPHFESTVETARKLTKLASEVDTTVERVQLSACGSKPEALRILERELWNFGLTRAERVIPNEHEQQCVHTVSCPNLYEESEAAALHILGLVQSGMHYGDIAIFVRDTETYRGVLDAAMERYGIPYFLSEATDLSTKPLSRLVLSALRAVNRHYQFQDVLTLVKTGLVGVDYKEAAMFEEYCETWHITGSRFHDAYWSMNPDGLTTQRTPRANEILDAANRVRKTVMEPLERLAAGLRSSARLDDRCRAIYEYLCTIKVPEQLAERAKAELASGQRKEAGETLRLYRFLTDTLTTICTLLPDTELTLDELIAALTLLFSNTQMSSVPSLHDCVVIGSAATVRVENIKATLLLGLCEGEFPKSVQDDGILSDAEKEQLEHAGINLASRERIRSSEELLYVYRAITKPTESLYLSTVEAQIDGSQRTPSLAFSRVCYLLDRKAESFDASALRITLDQPDPTEYKISLQASAAPSGTTLYLSQSKLQAFMRCPYSYYCMFRLNLREKKDSRPNYSNDGIFLHHVFETFLRECLGEDGKLHLPQPEEVESLADRIVDEYLTEICPLPPEQMDTALLHIFVRLRRVAHIMLFDILGELQMSCFTPYRFEQRIGSRNGDGLPSVTLELKDGSRVVLGGVVDRIDMYEKDGKVYVRVVDYKSGKHDFKLEDVRSGMDIQLVLYLFAVLSSDPDRLVPAGAQYLYFKTEKGKVEVHRSGFFLKDSDLQEKADRTEEKIYTKKLDLQTSEQIAELTEEMNEAIKQAAERILLGEAEKTPSEDACRFCSVRSSCGKAYPNKGGF